MYDTFIFVCDWIESESSKTKWTTNLGNPDWLLIAGCVELKSFPCSHCPTDRSDSLHLLRYLIETRCWSLLPLPISSVKTAKYEKWNLKVFLFMEFIFFLLLFFLHELFFNLFALSFGFAVNKQALTIEINLCSLHISLHVAMETFMTWLNVSSV